MVLPLLDAWHHQIQPEEKKMPTKINIKKIEKYLPSGMVFRMAFSVSSFSFAVMSDVMNPGAIALTCPIFVLMHI
jgi:hypothetical protein